MKKSIHKICNNCKLFDSKKKECCIIVLYEGTKTRIPVSPEDSCFFENKFIDKETNISEDYVDDIKEVKFWVEDKEGKKTSGNGTVKIEYPEGFFGN